MAILDLIIRHNTMLAAALTLGLGLWVYYGRREDPKSVACGTLLVTVSAWTFSLVLWRNANTPDESLFWLRTLFFIGSLIPLLFIEFVVAFVARRAPSRLLRAFTLAPSLLLFGAAYFTPFLASLNARTGQTEMNYGRTIFAVHFAVLLVLALGMLYRASNRLSESERPKLIFVLIGAIIAFNSIFGVLYGTSFTSEPTTIFIANGGLVVGMFVLTSAVVHRRFLGELRLLGPQLFMLLTLFVIIINIVVTETTIDFVLRVCMISILALYAGLMTRTMVAEARRIRRMEVLNEQAVKMNGELIAADRMKSRFVSLASHQLRAPVFGVRTYLEMMSSGDFGEVSDEQGKILRTNIDALGRLSETIDTFLDAAKIQLGKLEIYKTETALGSIVTKVIEQMRPLALKKALRLETEIPGNLPEVSCDEGKIFHVLVNLVDNAIKYTKSGAVVVSVSWSDDRIDVTVKDTGIGLSDAEKANIFEVFKRGMDAVRLDTGGSGLGLYIVKNIIDAHGGKMFVASEGRDKGTAIGFSLSAAA